MRLFFLIVLILHVLMEGIVGLILMFSPSVMVAETGGPQLDFVILYGSSGVTMALAAAWLWPLRNRIEPLGMGLGIFATFHTLVAVGGVIAVTNGSSPQIMIGHSVLAVLFWILWFKRGALVSG